MQQRLDSIAQLIIGRSAVPAEGDAHPTRPLPSILSLGREITRFGSIAAALDRSRRPAQPALSVQARSVQLIVGPATSLEASES